MSVGKRADEKEEKILRTISSGFDKTFYKQRIVFTKV
jgi:hypothetical protein